MQLTLDLVISRESSDILVGTPSLCDPQYIFQNIYRTYRGINIREFNEDLQSSQHLSNCEGSVYELVEAYNKGVQTIINHHDPCSEIITLRSWYSDKHRSSKKVRRKVERT